MMDKAPLYELAPRGQKVFNYRLALGLSPNCWRALEAINDRKVATLEDLIEELAVSYVTVQDILTILETRGFVRSKK